MGPAGHRIRDRGRHPRRRDPFDLILFGNESADAGNYQVAVRVAYALDLPVVNGIKGITADEGTLRCEREVAGGRDVYAVPTPAVVSVLEGINLPRYPSVPGRMRAKRKPLAASEPARAQPRLEMVAPPCSRRARASRPRCSATVPRRRRASSRSSPRSG